MRSKHPLLPIAIALAACLWTPDAMAQAGTIPITPSQESRPAAHAGIATHDTGDRPSTGELPGTGDRPGAGKRPGSEELFGTAQPAAGVDLDAAAELRQQALAAMEVLREEIATLTALKHAQAALLAWNRGLAEADEGPATLAGALCAEPELLASATGFRQHPRAIPGTQRHNST